MSQLFTGGGGGSGTIDQLDADPASPTDEQVWVLHTSTGGSGGLQHGVPSIGMCLGGAVLVHTYRLSYRTLEGTTKRVTLS